VSDAAGRLWQLIEPYVAAEGIELDDLEIAGGGKVSIVRVVIDAEDPIDVDRIARISRGLSRLLDEADPFPGAYTLEVSSPGLERKLRTPRHYAKSIGREVKVKTRTDIDGKKVHRGVLRAVNGDGFTISAGEGDLRIGFGDVAAAQTIFVWEKAAKPGSAKH
jgi:ribosome maturation factor RimP